MLQHITTQYFVNASPLMFCLSRHLPQALDFLTTAPFLTILLLFFVIIMKILCRKGNKWLEMKWNNISKYCLATMLPPLWLLIELPRSKVIYDPLIWVQIHGSVYLKQKICTRRSRKFCAYVKRISPLVSGECWFARCVLRITRHSRLTSLGQKFAAIAVEAEKGDHKLRIWR